MMRSLSARLAPVLALLVLGACDTPFTSSGDDVQRERLSDARALWTSRNVPSYSYVVELDCFCATASALEPVRVTVANGAVVSRVYVQDEDDTSPPRPAPDSLFGDYDTVNDLFEYVDDQVRGSPAVLNVSYDPAFGFPNLIAVDPSGSTPNDQRVVLVSSFAAAGS